MTLLWDEAADLLGLTLSKTYSLQESIRDFLVSVLVSLGTVKRHPSLQVAAFQKARRTGLKP